MLYERKVYVPKLFRSESEMFTLFQILEVEIITIFRDI